MRKTSKILFAFIAMVILLSSSHANDGGVDSGATPEQREHTCQSATGECHFLSVDVAFGVLACAKEAATYKQNMKSTANWIRDRK